MTSRIESIAIDTHDSHLLAEFWTRVLGWEIVDVDGPLIEIGPADGSGPTIDLLAVPESKTVKNRLHLDLRADGCTTEEEIDRVVALGARRVDVGQDPSVTWTVLADPEGNEFCILGRTHDEAHGPESSA
ncbi:VOC family protein [Williamsia phyllosphaerae]|nr:VOC family protein [Williamsia phyllosphaerae]